MDCTYSRWFSQTSSCSGEGWLLVTLGYCSERGLCEFVLFSERCGHLCILACVNVYTWAHTYTRVYMNIFMSDSKVKGVSKGLYHVFWEHSLMAWDYTGASFFVTTAWVWPGDCLWHVSPADRVAPPGLWLENLTTDRWILSLTSSYFLNLDSHPVWEIRQKFLDKGRCIHFAGATITKY